jgi:hypothetical protein
LQIQLALLMQQLCQKFKNLLQFAAAHPLLESAVARLEGGISIR